MSPLDYRTCDAGADSSEYTERLSRITATRCLKWYSGMRRDAAGSESALGRHAIRQEEKR